MKKIVVLALMSISSSAIFAQEQKAQPASQTDQKNKADTAGKVEHPSNDAKAAEFFKTKQQMKNYRKPTNTGKPSSTPQKTN